MEYLMMDDLPKFEITTKDITPGYITIVAREITSWGEDNKPIDISEYIRVPVKFDGGFHFNFASDGYLYLGTEDIEYHCRLMKRIHEIAKKHFNNEYI